ncbi:hypothetical protein [Devosia nitrariae]|uniref:HTH HARE-type domain-containing protein n=1 Tax=Devosia nitrariae TaxID=2071872 RepID=A0ABQ5W1M0_9HYPH|nr:hypothetical protein [Devosia nitrariae]GLQ53766.1 hypothetical protein GCM10010862_10250 [Devosia nitrariae]
MVAQLHEYLDQREGELLELIGELHRQLSPLEAELADVRKAKAAIAPDKPSAPSPSHTVELNEPAYARMTMKEMTVKALSEHFPRGATANKLIEFFHNAWGRTDIVRSSLSPQLSRLKQDNVIGLKGKLWYIPENEEGSDVSASEPDSYRGSGASAQGPTPTGTTPASSTLFHRVNEDLLTGTYLMGAPSQRFSPAREKGG